MRNITLSTLAYDDNEKQVLTNTWNMHIKQVCEMAYESTCLVDFCLTEILLTEQMLNEIEGHVCFPTTRQ